MGSSLLQNSRKSLSFIFCGMSSNVGKVLLVPSEIISWSNRFFSTSVIQRVVVAMDSCSVMTFQCAPMLSTSFLMSLTSLAQMVSVVLSGRLTVRNLMKRSLSSGGLQRVMMYSLMPDHFTLRSLSKKFTSVRVLSLAMMLSCSLST